MNFLTDTEYEVALAELAEYERRITESDRLAQRDSIKVAETLAALQADTRWIEEWNAQRAETGKTARSRRPVEASNRSQFSTWVRQRYKRIDPRDTYRLLDSNTIIKSFLGTANKTPTAEAQVRPLKNLLKVAHGSGVRIPEVWDIAIKLAGGDVPTGPQVKEAIAEWNRIHLTKAQQRQETAEDKAWNKERKAESAWQDLFTAGGDEQINKFLAVVRADIEQWEAQHAA